MKSSYWSFYEMPTRIELFLLYFFYMFNKEKYPGVKYLLVAKKSPGINHI